MPALKCFNINCISLINNTQWTTVLILVPSETLRPLIYPLFDPVNYRMGAKVDKMAEVGGNREVQGK